MHRPSFFALPAAFAASAMLTACAPHAPALEIAAATAPPPARRIVSLVPSLTEDLFALGDGSRVVGVSQFSDYPAAARRIPVVSSLTSVNVEQIVALHPDLVVGISSQRALTARFGEVGLRTLLLRDDSLDDLYADLLEIGRYTGRLDRAGALVTQLRARTAALRARVPHERRPPSVFVVLDTAPIFTVGDRSYIAQLITLAGGRNAASDLGLAYARYSAEALLARQPDVIVVDPAVALHGVLSRAPWSALRAVRNHHVYMLPDAAILERPGPRYNDGLAWLITTLQKAAS
jgi:ABC-type Fe3+-hydroxamate transport system substrate-binding protein